MYIVNVEDISRFRLAIAKSAFEYIYSNVFHFYDAVSPFEDKKEWIDAKEIKTEKECCIFLFEKPKTIPEETADKKKIIYYLKRTTKFPKNDFESRILSDEYVNFLNEESSKGFTHFANSTKFLSDYNDSSVPSDVYYKYYSSNQTATRFTSVISGNVSFVNPNIFNDPFDCDYNDMGTGRKKDSFKVLCLSPEYDNILMWSYYGNNHEGYCLGYNLKNILDNLSKVYKGLCIIGKVKYDYRRPKHVKTKALALFNEVTFIIECAFTKFNNWKHENEFRILVLDDNPSSDYLTINVPIADSYVGMNSSLEFPPLSPKKLTKDNIDYKLK